jgi:hypothetical protein
VNLERPDRKAQKLGEAERQFRGKRSLADHSSNPGFPGEANLTPHAQSRPSDCWQPDDKWNWSPSHKRNPRFLQALNPVWGFGVKITPPAQQASFAEKTHYIVHHLLDCYNKEPC